MSPLARLISPPQRSGRPHALHQLFKPWASPDLRASPAPGHMASGKPAPSRSHTPAAGSLLSPSASLPAPSLRPWHQASLPGVTHCFSTISTSLSCALCERTLSTEASWQEYQENRAQTQEIWIQNPAPAINGNRNYSNALMRVSQMYLLSSVSASGTISELYMT